MRPLAEVDRELDEIEVAPARLADVRARTAAVRPASLQAVDAELEALAAGTAPAPRAARAAAIVQDADEPVLEVSQVTAHVIGAEADVDESDFDESAAASDFDAASAIGESAAADEVGEGEVGLTSDGESDGPGSGLIEVSDEVLRSAELPAVLALDDIDAPPSAVPNAEIAGALSALALDLEAGDAPIELPPEPRRASPSTVPPPVEHSAELGLDDPNADLAALLGDADPLRDEGAAPVADDFGELEDEHTMMFTAADAARFSRPPPPDGASGDDFELDIEEVVLDEELLEPVSAPVARTQPPPPPRTQPPEPPKRPSEAPRGFLGKLLQRKP